jgi:hypothetical protein
MDGLVMKIGKALNGEKALDVASACAAVIAFSLKDASDDDREEAMKKINAFMRMCWK